MIWGASWLINSPAILLDFKIVHRPGKHNRLSRRTSRPCKRDTCPECATLINQATVGEESIRSVTPHANDLEYFDGYIEEAEDDSDLFRDPLASTKTKPEKGIDPELLWYLGRHSEQKEQTDTESNQATSSDEDQPSNSRPAVIKQLIDKDSRQAQTQTESHDIDVNTRGIDSETQTQELSEATGECHRVRAVNEKPKKANSALQALIDLSNIELTEAQDADPDLNKRHA